LGASGISYVLQGSSFAGAVPSLGVSVASANLMGPSPLPLNAWSHLAGTYDGTTMSLYVNGVLVASQAQIGTIAVSTDTLTIGGNPTYGENWGGLIDEVRIYNRSLNVSELQADMYRPVGGRPAPPSMLRIIGTGP
jgi:hypothetical protein